MPITLPFQASQHPQDPQDQEELPQRRHRIKLTSATSRKALHCIATVAMLPVVLVCSPVLLFSAVLVGMACNCMEIKDALRQDVQVAVVAVPM